MKLLQRLCIDSDKATRVWDSGIVDSLIQANKEKTFSRDVIAEWFALYTKLTNSDSASASLVQEKDVCPDIVHIIDKYMEDKKAGKLL